MLTIIPRHFFRERRWRVERRACDPERIREAVALLAAAGRPVLIAGGGVHYSQAWTELQEFAEALGIPVGETFAGKGRSRKSRPSPWVASDSREPEPRRRLSPRPTW